MGLCQSDEMLDSMQPQTMMSGRNGLRFQQSQEDHQFREIIQEAIKQSMNVDIENQQSSNKVEK